MTTPYYEADGILIYHGDCAEIAPTLGRFDLLCTDPPYGIGEARNVDAGRKKKGFGGKRSAAPRNYGASDWDDAPPGHEVLQAMREAAEWQCLFGGNYFALPPSSCWLVWDKENGANSFADAELAWTNYKCAVRLKRYRWNGYIRGALSGKAAIEAEPRYHPTQKPLAVMSWAISLCPDKPTSVLDPFMGSGTTLRACKDLGIRAVSIEREEKYCEIAARRLRQQTLALGAP
jgi:DNA modification methylase